MLMDTVLDGGAFCPDCASTLFISYNRLPVVEGLDPGGHGVHTCALGPSPSLDINSEKKSLLRQSIVTYISRSHDDIEASKYGCREEGRMVPQVWLRSVVRVWFVGP